MKLTPEQTAQIDAALELAASVFGAPGTELRNPRDAARYLRLRLADKPCEEFGIIWMDARNNVLEVETIGFGGADYVDIVPRRVINSAIRLNAVHAIAFHNHPSGDSEPSNADCMATEKYGGILGLLGCELLDHFVVGKNVYSIKEGDVIR